MGLQEKGRWDPQVFKQNDFMYYSEGIYKSSPAPIVDPAHGWSRRGRVVPWAWPGHLATRILSGRRRVVG